MADLPPYPPIDPTTFDLIIVGTGLSQSILGAAAASAGKSVLHLDPNPFYGSHSSSIPPTGFSSFLCPPELSTGDRLLTHRSVYSDVDIVPEACPEDSRKFILDVSGPRVLFCADKAIEIILRSGVNQYLEFKAIDELLIWDEGKLESVPDTRSKIFKDKKMRLQEKNLLMTFFKLVQQHAQEEKKISNDDLQRPFVDFLTESRLPERIKKIILYAIAMVDYDQDEKKFCKHILSTKDGIERLVLYNSSVSRFSNAPGAMIYPIYGQGELPQAFCRRAAVKGCIHVLRMPIIDLHVDESGQYRGVKLASDQDIYSDRLVLDPSYKIPSDMKKSNPRDSLSDHPENPNLTDSYTKVARAVCITGTSLRPDVSNVLVIFPPQSLFPQQATAVRALQIGGNMAICPPGMFVLYLSALCSEAVQGKESLQEAINALVNLGSDNTETSGSISDSTSDAKNAGARPVIWKAFYVQELVEGHYDAICSAPTPDGRLDYDNVILATIQLFENLYPEEKFFPETPAEDSDEDADANVNLEPES
ncbi:hypothetical protein MLD38_029550 [Melastoma candidum]|uniref:Uncharacterized protein n=1 Tax=Melastoma candidum TaxID=119954 RepID=A0ACB9N6J2_9MYRT|nr:hypothetical protein MLD38_029550 [Melastoma candidum]